MKTCNLQDFMEELKPWLDKDHIKNAVLGGDGRLTLHFLDGMKNVYSIDDCNATQVEDVLAKLKASGISIEKE